MKVAVELIANWRADYQRKQTSADQAAQDIVSGDSVYVHSNAAEPYFHEQLEAQAQAIKWFR